MNGIVKFSNAYVELAKSKLRAIEDRKEEFGSILVNNMFNLDGPKQLNEKASEEKEKILSRHIYSFTEIFDSYESLLDIEIYIRRFPYNKTRVTKIRYLRFIIENYLNEVYILKVRLINYLNTIKKIFKKSETYKDIEKIIEPLYSFISGKFKNIIEARGVHVHQNRFFDDDLKRLSTLELFLHSEKMSFIKDYYNFGYKNNRKKWTNFIKNNNIILKEILDIYFDQLYKVVFDKNGNFNYL